MSLGIHCDNENCNSWVNTKNVADSGFYTIFDGIEPTNAYFVAHFCSWDCIMMYAANHEHMERFEL